MADSNPPLLNAAEYLARVREELVRREVRFNTPYKLAAKEIEEGCRHSTSRLPMSTSEMMLTQFARAVKFMTGSTPPKELYPGLVDILAQDLEANLNALPTALPKDIVANTIRYGAIAEKLQERFPDLDNGHMIETAMRGYMKPEAFLEGIQHNYNRLRQHFPDEDAYPISMLAHKAFRETHGIGVRAAASTPDDRLFSGVKPKASSAVASSVSNTATGLDEARRATLEGNEQGEYGPSAILHTILTSTPETVDAIRRRVDNALGEDKKRTITNWQDRLREAPVAGKGPQK